MKSIAFAAFPGYLVGLPSVGTAQLSNSACDGSGLQLIAARINAIASRTSAADRAATPAEPVSQGRKSK